MSGTLLNERKWGSFLLGELFEVSLPSGDTQADKSEDGKIPLLSAGFNNNGICKFIKEGDEKSKLYPKNQISVDMFGKAFFHGYEFYCVSHGRVNILTPKTAMNQYHLKFIITAINASVKGKFSYNQMCSSKRVKRLIVRLPIDETGKPDFVFMEEYTKNEERKLINKYLTDSSDKLRTPPPRELLRLDLCKWRIFYIKDIFTITSGKRLRKEDMTPGDVPFVGASDSNNGVTSFVSNSNPSEDSNVLGVNYNGSVVENFYHPYKALFSDDVKRFHIKGHKGNKYIYLFLKTIISQQKNKYNYGYKFNDARMREQIIMLPVNEEGKPDWDFMENYAKNLEALMFKKYLEARFC